MDIEKLRNLRLAHPYTPFVLVLDAVMLEGPIAAK